MKNIFYTILLTGSFVFTACESEIDAVVDSATIMDCASFVSNYATSLSATTEIRTATAVPGETLSNLFEEAKFYQVSLKENASNIPIENPASESYKVQGSYGGFLVFTPKTSGNYYVLSSDRTWIEFFQVGSNGAIGLQVDDLAYTEDGDCGNGVRKVLKFPLVQDQKYYLHLSFNAKDNLKAGVVKE